MKEAPFERGTFLKICSALNSRLNGASSNCFTRFYDSFSRIYGLFRSGRMIFERGIADAKRRDGNLYTGICNIYGKCGRNVVKNFSETLSSTFETRDRESC